MAFTVPYRIYFSDSSNEDGNRLEFLHEIIKSPRPEEAEIFAKNEFNGSHTQDYYELIFFESGSRDIKTHGKVRKFSAGDVFVVCPGEEHCGRPHDCVLDRYYIHIGKNVFDSLGENGKSLMKIFNIYSESGSNLIRLSSYEKSELRSLLADIDNIIKFSTESIKDIEIYAIIIRILSLFCAVKSNTKQKSKNETTLSILAYIENSYDDADVINNAAKSIGVSRSTLRRLLADAFSVTPSEYLLQIRLQNAKRLLENGESVTNTAMKCGFPDCSHFIKKFKNKYSVTPLKYKAGFGK